MAIAYVAPFCLYLGGTALISHWPEHYPLSYLAVVIGVGMATVWLLRGKAILKPHWNVLPGLVVGVIGVGVWIGLAELAWERQLGRNLPEWLRPEPRLGFNPHSHFSDPLFVWGFVSVRLLGLVVLVPIVEEIFWRGFLARWLEDPDWEQVPLGRFSTRSFLGVVALFTLAHPEWLAAAAYCALLNGLLLWKRDLWNCVIAHAVSNCLLAVYILGTESWSLW